ncbi:hypothetical protein E6H20_02815 [Candidatus Bathyarchaeota archaeon]|nr:MAG: hypothetical protein E6H20_02815 [Candidatus Bathyarchaeota archaeon]
MKQLPAHDGSNIIRRNNVLIVGEKKMAVREDWTRITQSIHNFFHAFRSPTRGAMERSCNNMVKSPMVKPTILSVRSTVDARSRAEIERRRNQVYLYSVKNQIR